METLVTAPIIVIALSPPEEYRRLFKITVPTASDISTTKVEKPIARILLIIFLLKAWITDDKHSFIL